MPFPFPFLPPSSPLRTTFHTQGTKKVQQSLCSTFFSLWEKREVPIAMSAPATSRLRDWFDHHLGHMDTLLNSEVDARYNPELATVAVPLNAKPNHTTTVAVATEKRQQQTPAGTGMDTSKGKGKSKGNGKGKQPARCTAPPARRPPLPDLTACTNDANSALQEYLDVLHAMNKDYAESNALSPSASPTSSLTGTGGCASEAGFFCRASSGQHASCQTPSLQPSVFAKAEALNTAFLLHAPIAAVDVCAHTHGHEDEDGYEDGYGDDDHIMYKKESRLLGYKPIVDISAPLDLSNVQAKVNSFRHGYRPRIERINAKRNPKHKAKPKTSAWKNMPHTTKPKPTPTGTTTCRAGVHTSRTRTTRTRKCTGAGARAGNTCKPASSPPITYTLSTGSNPFGGVNPRVRGDTTKRSTQASAINTAHTKTKTGAVENKARPLRQERGAPPGNQHGVCDRLGLLLHATKYDKYDRYVSSAWSQPSWSPGLC